MKTTNDKHEDGSIVNFAKRELDILLKEAIDSKDNDAIEMQKIINDNILELLRVFERQGHSGFSASYVLNHFKRLANFQPITALTGKEDEWVEIGENCEQNIRCPSVFRDNKDNSTARNIDDIAISDNGGVTFFGGSICEDFRKPIKFPYVPPDHPRKIFIKWLDKDMTKYEVVEDENELKKQREEFRARMEESGY